MAYRDTWVECEQCEKQFVYRVEQQRQQEKQGVPVVPPELCSSCRQSTQRHREPQPQRERGAESRPQAAKAPASSDVLGYGPHEGVVKWYNSEKGYGFIAHSAGKEVFFHHTGIAPGESHEFPDGTRVTFVVEETERGPQAVEVERME